MSYPTQLNDAHMLILAPILETINSAKPGDFLTFTYETPRYCERVRQTFYTWCFLENKKALFKTRKLRPTVLQIELVSFQEPRVQGAKLSPGEEFYIEHLLDITDQREAQAIIDQACLEPPDALEAITEWRRNNL